MDAILARRQADHHRHVRVVELQTRYLVGAFAGTKAAAAVSFLAEPRQTVTPQLDTLVARYGQPLLRLGAPDGQ